ncbi:MAG: adenine deaminase [Proteobacteria bacterium]|nr:adenine deaminase [Pseudomonadota bacterium]
MTTQGHLKGHLKGVVSSRAQLALRIAVASGSKAPDLIVRGSTWLDVFSGQWRTGDVAIFDGVICGVSDEYQGSASTEVIHGQGKYLVPGFVDSHVHIESSMMTPKRFQEAVVPQGTTTVIWDPHEIANVKGTAGIDWALKSTEELLLDVFVMVPSCVPSTSAQLNLETSGASLNASDIEKYKSHPRVLGLAEMMNWPGLVGGDPEVMDKLQSYQSLRRDGHCPGLAGKNLNAYAVAGIHSCHESTNIVEASEKLSKGIHVLIREGSCAKDADALLPMVTARSAPNLGLCSDDRNPLDIEESGHINCILNKGLAAGIDPVDLFISASFAPANMYGLGDRGAVAPGYLADLVLIELNKIDHWASGFRICQVLKNGRSVTEGVLCDKEAPTPQRSLFSGEPVNKKNLNTGYSNFSPELFSIKSGILTEKLVEVLVIGVRPGQILTDKERHPVACVEGKLNNDLNHDIIKIAVLERHHATKRVGIGFVRGFGIKSGAVATSINHDCHNIIVTGSSDELMAKAVQELHRIDGGIVVVDENGQTSSLSLPVGGLMTDAEPATVSQSLRKLKSMARDVGCVLHEPFLQLSFLALPVIPSLKITDFGIVDAEQFKVVSLFNKDKNTSSRSEL